MIRIALWTIGYRRIRSMLPVPAETRGSIHYARQVAFGIDRVARFVPGASCLTQALAAQWLLTRSGHRSDIRVGVELKTSGRLAAHAWLICNGEVVLGGSEERLARFHPLVELS